MKDPNYAIKLERAIKDKYGEKAIINPKADWSEEEEKSYQEQKQITEKNQFFDNSSEEKDIKHGYLLRTKLIKKEERVCPKCKTYSFSTKDDLYYNKFNMCYKCYLNNEWVMGNEKCITNK